MNIVVLTAALSSLNSGPVFHRPRAALAGDGRLGAALRRADERAQGALWRHPRDARDLSLRRRAELFGAGQVFEIVLNIASLGIVSTWAFIVVCQMKLRARQLAARLQPVPFRMPLRAGDVWLTLASWRGCWC